MAKLLPPWQAQADSEPGPNPLCAEPTFLGSFLSRARPLSLRGLGGPRAQRPGLAAGAALLLGAGAGAAAEASCRKMRSLRRRVHRSSSLASGPASKPGSLGPRSLRALRPLSAASLALSGLPGPRAQVTGAASGELGSPGAFLGRSSVAGGGRRTLTSLSESVYSNSVPVGTGGGTELAGAGAQTGPHPNSAAGNQVPGQWRASQRLQVPPDPRSEGR